MDTGKLLTLAGLGVGGYFLYEYFFAAPAATAAPASPVTPVTPAPTAGGTVSGSTVVTSPAAGSGTQHTTVSSLAAMYSNLLGMASTDTQFTGSGDNLSGTGYQWGFYLQRVLQPGQVVDLPLALYLSTVFPGQDMTKQMTASAFWAGMGPAVGKLYGLSGLGWCGLGDDTIDYGFSDPAFQAQLSQAADASFYTQLGAATATVPTGAAAPSGMSATTLALLAVGVLGIAMVAGRR